MSLLFPHNLFHVNDVPSAAEAAAICEFLTRKEEEISRCDAEVNRLREEIERLNAHRRAEEMDIKASRALLSPLRRFPPELLSEIFLYSLSPSSSHTAPLILCWVCQKWRNAALSSPALWSSPRVNISRHTSPSKALAKRWLYEHWLTHSRQLPLDIHMSWPDDDDASKFRPLCDMFLTHTSRWKRIHFFSLSHTLRLPELPACSAPLLETAYFGFILLHWGEAEMEWALKILRPATQLRTLTWRGPAYPLLELSLPKLTKVALNVDGGIPILHLIRLCHLAPLLEGCTVEFSVGTDAEDGILLQGLDIVHTRLKILDITTFEDAQRLDLLFDLMTLPALEEITILAEFSHWPAGSFSSFLTRSSCSLSSLAMSSRITDRDLIRLFQHNSTKGSLVSLDLTSDNSPVISNTASIAVGCTSALSMIGTRD